MVRHHKSHVQPSRLALILVVSVALPAAASVWLLPFPRLLQWTLLTTLVAAVVFQLWRCWFYQPLDAIACNGEGLQIKRRGQALWQGCIMTPLFASPWFIACRLFLPESRQVIMLGLFRDQLDESVFRRLAAFSRGGRAPS